MTVELNTFISSSVVHWHLHLLDKQSHY